VFFTGSRVVATGDLYVPMLGVCDWPNGCRWEDYVSGIRRLTALVHSDAVILPGHGPPNTAAELREFAGLLEDVTGRVRRAMAAGRSREQVVAEGLPTATRPGLGAAFPPTSSWATRTTRCWPGQARSNRPPRKTLGHE
jgi:glyoxylase-like metal-dependent hydrolase (beta-lactamase superfamily II)